MTENALATVAPREPSIADRMMVLIEKAASDPTFDAAKAKAFLDMQIIVMDKQAHIDFAEAKARIKAELQVIKIVKTRQVAYDIDKNDKSKGQKDAFKYAALEDIDKFTGPLLSKEGITDSYTMESIGNGWYQVTCRLSKGLYTENTTCPLPLDTSGGKNNTQGVGSSFMYGRRYTLCSALGLVILGLDDDATGGCIDDAQAAHIKDLIQKSGTDTLKFLKYMKAPNVEEIAFRDYRRATSALEEKMNAVKKPAAKAEAK